MRYKRAIIFVLILLMLFTLGCWDMVEIEKRALVGAITIDLNDKENDKNPDNESKAFCEDKSDRLRVMFGVNNAAKMMEGGQGAIPVTVNAANIPDAMEELGSRVSRIPFYGHVRLLVLTEKLVKDQKVFRQILDEFERKAIINQQMKILVLKGKPEDVLKVEPKLENVQSAVVTGIMDNSRVLSDTVNMSLNKMLSSIRSGDGSTVIPVLEVKDDKNPQYIINELALIKDYKFLDYLESRYIKSYKLITGQLDSGRKLVKYKDMVVPFYIFTSKRRIWLLEDKDRLKFKIRIELEGDVEQFELGENLFDDKIIKDIEKAINESTELELKLTTEHMQRAVGHDFLGFKDYLYKYHNKVYKKHEKDWDKAFKAAEIDYEVNTKVRRIGSSKK